MANFVLANSGHNRDDEASKFGMWLFLFTELLLFGGLFLVYTIYRYLNSEAFLHASYELDVVMGTVNTVVLLTSSLTVALSITALQKGNVKLTMWLLIATILFALTFLVIKYFEWSAKFEHGLFPGMDHYNHLPAPEKMFFFLYFFMTGLHGLHVIVGGALLGFIMWDIKKKRTNSDNFVYLENGGLYWHLVDIIWIFLFPLFYLIH